MVKANSPLPSSHVIYQIHVHVVTRVILLYSIVFFFATLPGHVFHRLQNSLHLLKNLFVVNNALRCIIGFAVQNLFCSLYISMDLQATNRSEEETTSGMDNISRYKNWYLTVQFHSFLSQEWNWTVIQPEQILNLFGMWLSISFQ